jgi:DNA polymerase elongation subunit (family B)
MNNIIESYNKQIFDMYMSAHPNANPQRVMDHIVAMSKHHLRDLPIIMHNNITKERLSTTLTSALEWVETRKPIITGNGSFFMQHKEYLSPVIKMLEALQKLRGFKKKIMYEKAKGTPEYSNAFTSQNSIKTIANADYGGCGTVYSPFFSMYIPASTCAAAKALTTTLICCLEFTSGSNSKWCKLNHINELFDMINIILGDTEDRNIINVKFTVDEVSQRLCGMTNNMSIQCVKTLRTFLSTLSQLQLTKLMLAFNVHYVLENHLAGEVASAMEYYKQNQIEPLKFKHLLELKTNEGTAEALQLLNESGFGEKIPSVIEKDVLKITKVVMENCIYSFMLNDNEVRATHMKRKIVCVTDTDSLMVHFSHYIDAFQCRGKHFKKSCILAAALGMRLFVEGIIPKFVRYIAVNCRIEDPYYYTKFAFKNEYGILAMTMKGKKMYAMSTFAQEGHPRNPWVIDITGLTFKKRDSAEFLEPIMLALYRDYVLTSDEIQVDKIMDAYADLREQLIREIPTTTKYFIVKSIKDVSAYDVNKTLPAQMKGSIIWNNMSPDEQIMPMDRAQLIQLSWEAIDANMHDSNVAELARLQSIVAKGDVDGKTKRKDPYICIPEHYDTIPEWIIPIIDVEVMTDKILAPAFKQMFDLFSVVMPETKGGMRASRMIEL